MNLHVPLQIETRQACIDKRKRYAFQVHHTEQIVLSNSCACKRAGEYQIDRLARLVVLPVTLLPSCQLRSCQKSQPRIVLARVDFLQTAQFDMTVGQINEVVARQ